MKRINFASIPTELDYPDFLNIQVESFRNFFQLDMPSHTRKKEGLYRVFEEHFPISDPRETLLLEFVNYSIDSPRYSLSECLKRGLTYSVPIRLRIRLSSTDEEADDSTKTIEQEVFLGSIPYMTERGSFVINGAERVVVSQLRRSPGVFFAQSKYTSATKLYSARVIPFKGSWIEFATDAHQVMYAYIDRKKKFPVTTLLRAIGYGSDKDILDLFGLSEEIKADKKSIRKALGRRLAARVLKTWVEDLVDEDTGEVTSIERSEITLERDTVIEEKDIATLLAEEVPAVIVHKEDPQDGEYAIIYNTLRKDSSNSEEEALKSIYRQLRNVDAPDEQAARDAIQNLFFSEKRYDLGDVGRYRINKKLGLSTPDHVRTLTREDIVVIVKHLISLINSKAVVDDIDHLSNRRVRTVGEQLHTHFGLGLSRMARTIRERMNVRDNEEIKPVDLVNAKTLSSVINTFFGTSQLSQFMDQTNPLAELTHKRRVSALGPGGLSRERAGFEVRDVHYTHYGRLCTIETPEGPNIGLISSLCVYAKVNHMGFIVTPYRKVKNGVVKKEIVHLTAEDEDEGYIVQANALLTKDNHFVRDKVKTRLLGDFPLVSPSECKYMDVGTNQTVSIAASLIPFLEHDDANRALMGSNMQRQAVPLLCPEPPIVGTGMEMHVACGSRNLFVAEGPGEVVYADANHIDIRYDLDEMEKIASFKGAQKTYVLPKFQRTNQDTCLDLKPIVKKGQRVKKGQILCRGFATHEGELALGANLMVAFMPWKGYNFEDAILISDRVVREDVFTSIHVEEFQTEIRDMKRGSEEFTPEIPNTSEEAVRHLNDDGIVCTGARVKGGDILVGKITPKGEADPTPEEKLLRAIFGDKAGDVRDASLRGSPSLEGVVIDTKHFERPRLGKSMREDVKKKVKKLKEEYARDLSAHRQEAIDKLCVLLEGKISEGIVHRYKETLIAKGKKCTRKEIENNLFPLEDSYTDSSEYVVPEESNRIADVVLDGWVSDEKINHWVRHMVSSYLRRRDQIAMAFKNKRYSLEVGDELPTGVVQLAKVYVARKRKLKVGDKMAGRHGNKGVVAKIVRQEDMPFTEDGTPMDIVLNPLSVPSRMNVGQIYETVLGWAGLKLGHRYATPIFDGASIEEVSAELEKAKLPPLGRTYLHDGLTGDRFDQQVTVGVIYMMKLNHLVDDKVHARSIGPYSLITQQPLGGKSQFGGQRFGEMEVWALEAFGASHLLREMLTVKADDITGRAKVYEAIVKGESIPEPGIPESFNVLIHELRGLGLSIQLD